MRNAAPILLLLSILLPSLLGGGCKHPTERRRERARLDSLRRDTSRPAINPYKTGQGTAGYDRERENLGNLDSLVTPSNPAPPRNPAP